MKALNMIAALVGFLLAMAYSLWSRTPSYQSLFGAPSTVSVEPPVFEEAPKPVSVNPVQSAPEVQPVADSRAVVNSDFQAAPDPVWESGVMVTPGAAKTRTNPPVTGPKPPAGEFPVKAAAEE